MIKPSKVAEELGVHIRTLQRWDNTGKFVAHRTVGGRRYYTKEQVEWYKNGEFEKLTKEYLERGK